MNLGDVFRKVYQKADSLWIKATGRPVVDFETGNSFRAFYELPDWKENCRHGLFGIDVVDEMEVEADYSQVLECYGYIPPKGTILVIEDQSWQILHRYSVDCKFSGKGRLVFVVVRYQESVTNTNDNTKQFLEKCKDVEDMVEECKKNDVSPK
jgi:hypothetical protein